MGRRWHWSRSPRLECRGSLSGSSVPIRAAIRPRFSLVLLYQALRQGFCVDQFQPHRLLRNAHLMTLAGALLPRRAPALPRACDRLLRSRTRNAPAGALPLAARAAPVPRFGRRARARGLQRIRLYARLGGRRLRRRLQRAPHQPAQLRRHRTAYAHALQFRPERATSAPFSSSSSSKTRCRASSSPATPWAAISS